MKNYIIAHDEASLNLFKNSNLPFEKSFNYILVGDKEIKGDFINAKMLKDNIEHYKSLLTFTAWYALVKNNLIESEFIGLFEYDTIFLNHIDNIILEKNTILGFIPRSLPDNMYLDCIPYFKNLLSEKEKDIALNQPFWLTTSNLIMPKSFLIDFVDWYLQFIPKIFNAKNHPHFHERAINVFAANFGYKQKTVNLLLHKQLSSHNIKFNEK